MNKIKWGILIIVSLIAIIKIYQNSEKDTDIESKYSFELDESKIEIYYIYDPNVEHSDEELWCYHQKMQNIIDQVEKTGNKKYLDYINYAVDYSPEEYEKLKKRQYH